MVGIGFAPNLALVAVAGALVAVGTGAFQAVNWALMSDDIPDGQGASAYGLANVATAGASALAGLFGLLVDGANLIVPGGTYQITFGLAALIALTSLDPIRRVDVDADSAGERP
jgi:MFS family permease